MRTRVGYAGGTLRNPTYQTMGDHTETFQVDFDPTVIRYEELLDRFWASHDPTSPSYSRQYRNLILTADEAQERAAQKSLQALTEKLGKPVLTPIESLVRFTRAEDYHQKFTLRGWKQVAGELLHVYRDSKSFTDSTAAMRLNAYLAGQGDPKEVEADLPKLGLSAAALQVVRERCQR